MDGRTSHRVVAHPAGARQVIPEPRRRWLGGGVEAGGWQPGPAMQPEFVLPQLWKAAPVEVVAPRAQRVRVVEGRLGVTIGDERSVHRPGDVVELPAGVRASLWNAGVAAVRLVDEYSPPMRRATWLDGTLPVRAAPSRRRWLSSFAVLGAIAAVVGVVLRRRARRR